MVAQNFPAEEADELVFEGGYVDDPKDPGGITDFGITLHLLSAFLGHPASVAELTGMSGATKAAIYLKEFWVPIRGDDLPSGVDLVVFDMAVNGGPSRAAKMLQTALSVTPVDGVIGRATLGALAGRKASSVIMTYGVMRRNYYRSLPGFPHDGTGWLARVAACETKALALVA